MSYQASSLAAVKYNNRSVVQSIVYLTRSSAVVSDVNFICCLIELGRFSNTTNILHKQKYALTELQDVPRFQISPEIQINSDSPVWFTREHNYCTFKNCILYSKNSHYISILTKHKLSNPKQFLTKLDKSQGVSTS